MKNKRIEKKISKFRNLDRFKEIDEGKTKNSRWKKWVAVFLLSLAMTTCEKVQKNSKREPTLRITEVKQTVVKKKKQMSKLDAELLNTVKNFPPSMDLVTYEKIIKHVKELVEKGANVNVEDEYGYTPLDYAQFNRSDEISKYLIEHGAKNGSRKPY